MEVDGQNQQIANRKADLTAARETSNQVLAWDDQSGAAATPPKAHRYVAGAPVVRRVYHAAAGAAAARVAVPAR